MMERLTVQQLIDRYGRRLRRDASGSDQYEEHYTVIQYLQWLQHYQSLGTPFTRLRDLAEAHREDRLAVLPCRVGTPVWVIESGRRGSKVRATRIIGFLYDGDQIEVCVSGSGAWYRLGDDAFLTSDRAERALKGGR